MSGHTLHREVHVAGRRAAWADLDFDYGSDDDVFVSVHVAHARLSAGERRLLVERIVADIAHAGAHHLVMSLPLGDSDLLKALHDNVDQLSSRSAGSTCLVDGRIGLAGERAGRVKPSIRTPEYR